MQIFKVLGDKYLKLTSKYEENFTKNLNKLGQFTFSLINKLSFVYFKSIPNRFYYNIKFSDVFKIFENLTENKRNFQLKSVNLMNNFWIKELYSILSFGLLNEETRLKQIFIENLKKFDIPFQNDSIFDNYSENIISLENFKEKFKKLPNWNEIKFFLFEEGINNIIKIIR